MAILNAVALNGGHFVLENPASRSDPTQVVTYDPALAEHGPLWLMPEVALLKATHSATLITFAQCMIGSKHQKYTSLLASPLAAAGLTPLTHLKCNHSKGQHDALVGKDGQGTWLSERSAAYPTPLARALAAALPISRPSANTAPPSAPPPAIQGTDSAHAHAEVDDLHVQAGPPATPPNTLSKDTPNAPPLAGPRPGGGAFNMRPRAPDITPNTTPTAGPRPGGGTFGMRPRTTLSSALLCLAEVATTKDLPCIIVPNSTVGFALQAVTGEQEDSPRNRKIALQQNKSGYGLPPRRRS